MPLLSGLLCLRLLAAPAGAAMPALAPAPAAYQAVLDRRTLDVERLRALGYAFETELCFPVDAAGHASGPALTPAQLDAALDAKTAKTAAPLVSETSPPRPILTPALDPSPKALEALYDGTPFASAGTPVAEPPAATPAPAPARPSYVEPPFDASWGRIQAALRNPKKILRGLQSLASRFRKDSDSPTGLIDDAPEALRLLASAIHDDEGGPAALGELRRELTVAANLKVPQKFEFAQALASPLAVYTALGRSQASHSLDSQLYFRRMETLLAADGLTLSAFIAAVDPGKLDAQTFLLRAHAYDALLPYLLKHPGEAAALAPLLFPDGRPGEIRAHASQLEGFMTQLAEQGADSGALENFVRSLLAYSGSASPETATRVAVYLKVNERLLPESDRSAIDALSARLPPGLLENSGLIPPDPYDSWPADRWNFVLRFADPRVYAGWRREFLASGYRQEADRGGVTLSKAFGGLKVVVRGRVYRGDKDGFLRGAVARRFLSDVARDLRDAKVQGVILRNHAQFSIASLLGRGVTPGKLVLDGSCRSAWNLQGLRRACPACSFIVNTGTGHTRVNAAADLAVIEGLARRKSWADIGAEWTRLNPDASLVQGPWTPPYSEALDALSSRGGTGSAGAGAPAPAGR